eukprot:SM000038S14296  [mRNA]  locus=s38:174165:181898:+ [translate_table: standard]
MAAQLRDGRLTVVELASGDSYIISSSPREKDTKLIAVDPTTGALDHCGRRGLSVFPTEHDCLEHITAAGRFPIKSAVQGKALIGYAALGAVGAVLLATKTKLSIPSLPGGDAVHTVTGFWGALIICVLATTAESQWVRARLRMPHVQTKAELKAAEDLMSILIDTVHFYCETRDITRPFPSDNNVDDPDEEFVWNEWLSSPFKDIGLKHHCVVLLQGMAESRTFTDASDKLLAVALVARRSRMHPGTRYLARGLNAAASTGNEVECEQLVWQAEAGGLSAGRSSFCTYVWRRGTVPIWWGAEIKTYVSEAEIFVSDKPYEGAATYYKRLQLRYGGRSQEQSGADAAQTPIYVLNLLRNGPGKPESVLTEHLHHSIRQIVTNKELPRAELTALNFDWHASTKAVGEARTVEDLWRVLKEPTKRVAFTSGEYLPITLKDHGVIAGASNGQVDGQYTLSTLQTGVIRYNCADSLDRTNAASFFGGVQVLAEQCSRLGSSLMSMSSRNAGLNLGAASLGVNDDSVSGRTSASATSSSAQTSEPPPLPPGWEMRKHAFGQYFYIDHIRRVTTWTRPLELVVTTAPASLVSRRDDSDKHNADGKRRASEPAEGWSSLVDEAEPWAWFDLSVEALKARALAAPIAALAELFLIAGDIHALLYTGSKAMHSHIIQIFSEDPAKLRRANAASNVAITLQRRYLNMVVDSSRQRQLEAFLGLALPKIFPSLALRPLEVLSRAYACLLKPVPAHFQDMHPLEALLSPRTNSITWVCPGAADIVEVYIYLREPCHISALILTSAHGVDDGSTPSCMDVRAGQHLDDMQLLLEGASIPRCPAGTALLYNLAGTASGLASGRWHSNNKPFMLYNYEQTDRQYEFFTRVVAVTFYPAVPGVPMTLGQLEVLGASLLGFRFSPPSQASQRLPCSSGGAAQSQGSADASRSSTYSAKPEQPVTFDLLSGDPLGVQDAVSRAPLDESSIVNPAGLRKVPQRNAPLPPATADFEHSASRRSSALGMYQNLVHKICSPQRDEVMSFSLALRLDAARLRLGLSSLEREQVLLKLGKDPHSLDPNHLLSTAQELLQLHRAAAQLSRLAGEEGQTVADHGDLLGRCNREDCEVGSGKGGRHDPLADVDDSEYVQARRGNSVPLLTCETCKRMACGACVAGTAGTQLVERLAMVAPASHASTSKAHTVKSMLCWDCCPSLVRNALLLNQVRALEASRQACQLLDSAAAALSMLRNSGVWNRGPEGGLPGVPKELVSLAEHPYGALLFAVPTADGYEPAQSLLWRPTLKSPAACWQAPAGALSVDLSIVLSTPGILFKLAFYLVPTAHAPYELAVNMWTGNNVTERKLAGNWKFVNDQQHIVLDLESPIYCRIVSLRIEVQTTQISQSPPLLDLLSMDDMPPPSPFSIQSGRPPTLTLRRIVLLGVPDFNEFAALAKKQGSATATYAALLETPPKLVRSRVQVEGERSRAGGRIIEMVIHPLVPEVAGFRLEALSCGLSTSPGLAQAAVNKDAAEAEVLKHALSDFLLATGPLVVHVSAVQDSRGPLPLGEFAIPVIRPGTSLCFDFSSPTSARLIILEVTGDITGCPDESLLDHGDLGGREATVCGLSLQNKVRLYRYVHPGELGKWGQANAP